MFERESGGNNPKRRAMVENQVLAAQKLSWGDVQCLSGKQAREARYVLESLAAMCDRRHGISLEQSHAKGKSNRENAKTAAK